MSTRIMCWIALALLLVVWWAGFLFLLSVSPVSTMAGVGFVAVVFFALLQDEVAQA